jgi:dienelactone hydrolase
VNEVFEDIEKTTVVYGSNVDVFGDSIDLSMDIYSPQDDNAYGRAVVILAHGGSFIGGMRQDMDATCERFAKSGYVAATIDYRLLSLFQGLPDSTKALDITVKASHDMKAAIRWFKHSAIANDNPYNIDPDMMFIGGYSAGAVTALLAGVFDEEDSDLPFIQELLEANGGFQGSTGNPDYLVYGEDVQGIINYSGAVYDTAWIDADDPVITSYHGTADETVPYGYDNVIVLGQEIVPLHGSGSIHAHLEEKELPNLLYSVEGGGHTDIYFFTNFEEDRIAANASSDTLLAEIICGVLVGTKDHEVELINSYPNPTTSQLFINGISLDSKVVLFNKVGQQVLSTSYNNGINVADFEAGIYFYHIEDGEKKYVGKFVKL